MQHDNEIRLKPQQFAIVVAAPADKNRGQAQMLEFIICQYDRFKMMSIGQAINNLIDSFNGCASVRIACLGFNEAILNRAKGCIERCCVNQNAEIELIGANGKYIKLEQIEMLRGEIFVTISKANINEPFVVTSAGKQHTGQAKLLEATGFLAEGKENVQDPHQRKPSTVHPN